jgi:hypothetical protein
MIQGQPGLHSKFEAKLCHILRPCLKKENKVKKPCVAGLPVFLQPKSWVEMSISPSYICLFGETEAHREGSTCLK